jgi:hypothetical protein
VNELTIAARLEKLRLVGAFTWDGLRRELGVSKTLLHYVKTGQKPVSAKMERKVRELETRLGLRSAIIPTETTPVRQLTKEEKLNLLINAQAASPPLSEKITTLLLRDDVFLRVALKILREHRPRFIEDGMCAQDLDLAELVLSNVAKKK